jgi:5-methylcytosine-specific restriction endonuclease McrA
LVLNADFSFIQVTASWFNGVRLLIRDRARSLASYDDIVHSESEEIPIPAVVILKNYARLGRRRPAFSFPTKRNVLIRDGFKCAYCETSLTMGSGTKDHVIPRARGGKDVLDNVVAACKQCNGLKADKSPGEVGLTLKWQPRMLTDEEKIEVITKTHKSFERSAWMTCLKKMDLSLF